MLDNGPANKKLFNKSYGISNFNSNPNFLLYILQKNKLIFPKNKKFILLKIVAFLYYGLYNVHCTGIERDKKMAEN